MTPRKMNVRFSRRAKAQIERVLSPLRAAGRGGRAAEVEIAFFGGSFTAIPRPLMLSLLSLASRYLRAGETCGIRLSTRPDCLSEEILDILEEYGAYDVEIGVQSLSDEVLRRSGRGHTAADSLDALRRMNRRRRFRPVWQMMLGLPGSDLREELQTAALHRGRGDRGGAGLSHRRSAGKPASGNGSKEGNTPRFR